MLIRDIIPHPGTLTALIVDEHETPDAHGLKLHIVAIKLKNGDMITDTVQYHGTKPVVGTTVRLSATGTFPIAEVIS